MPGNRKPQHGLKRRQSSEQLLLLHNQDPALFESRTVTDDETWVHGWNPQLKLERMAWKEKGSRTPIKYRTQHSDGKTMATIIWDCKGVLMLDYVPRERTFTDQYYT